MSNELDSLDKAIHILARIQDISGISKHHIIGHRVVHSGPKMTAHVPITPQGLTDVEQAIPFAPLHEPIALETIHEAIRHFPGVTNYSCFDTIFHQTMPEVAAIYPAPKTIRYEGVQRYDFHEISCESILQRFQDGRVPRSISIRQSSKSSYLCPSGQRGEYNCRA